MTVFCVIVKVPEPSTGGNLASSMGDLWVEVPKKNPDDDDVFEQVDALSALHVYTPVFTLGEILVLDEEDGREVGGMGRAPRKWFVEVEHYDDINKAVRRARAVQGW